jgi:hypothetical protein
MTQTWKQYGKMMLAVAGLFLYAPQHASATDVKIYPATMCMEYGDGSYYQTARWSAGSIVNLSPTYSASLLCPVVRDNTTKGWEYVRVSVTDRHQYQDISCLFAGINPTRTINYQIKYSTGTGNQNLFFQNGSCGNSCIGDGAQSYLLSCVIPPKQSASVSPSEILLYVVGEP